MTIITTDTKKTITITLKTWDGSQWSADMFDDMEDIFAATHDRLPGSDAISATQSEVDDMIDYWKSEVEAANSGKYSEQFGSPEDREERGVAGTELALEVDEG